MSLKDFFTKLRTDMKPEYLRIILLLSFVSMVLPQRGVAIAAEWEPRMEIKNHSQTKEKLPNAKKARFQKRFERRIAKYQSKKPILGEALSSALLLVFGILAAVFLLIGLIGFLSILFFFLAALAILAALVVVIIES